MTMKFVPPSEYFCVRTGDMHGSLDVAFVPIPVGATREDCVAYVHGTLCELLPDSSNARKMADMLSDRLPQVGSLVVPTYRDYWLAFSGQVIASGKPFAGDDLLLCCRLSVYGWNGAFPKEPFTGICRHVKAAYLIEMEGDAGIL